MASYLTLHTKSCHYCCTENLEVHRPPWPLGLSDAMEDFSKRLDSVTVWSERMDLHADAEATSADILEVCKHTNTIWSLANNSADSHSTRSDLRDESDLLCDEAEVAHTSRRHYVGLSFLLIDLYLWRRTTHKITEESKAEGTFCSIVKGTESISFLVTTFTEFKNIHFIKKIKLADFHTSHIQTQTYLSWGLQGRTSHSCCL